MRMIKKSISVTEQQNSWISAQVATGHYGNESELIRDLIRERQMQQRESTEEIAFIREKLIDAEASGFCNQSITEIWEEARTASGKE